MINPDFNVILVHNKGALIELKKSYGKLSNNNPRLNLTNYGTYSKYEVYIHYLSISQVTYLCSYQ